MSKKPDLSTKRNRRRSGSARIIEITLYIMPTFATIFGFLDIGMILFTWNTMQNAVREGVRYAITYQMNGATTHRQAIKNKTAQWMIGWVSATETSATAGTLPYVDVLFYQPGGSVAVNSNATGNVIEVSIKNYPYKYMAPFSGSFSSPFYATPGSQFTLASYATDVMGGTPGSTPPPVD